MTRKDFEGLASILRDLYPVPENNPNPNRYWLLCVNELASWCATQNPRFDRHRFLKACGLEG